MSTVMELTHNVTMEQMKWQEQRVDEVAQRRIRWGNWEGCMLRKWMEYVTGRSASGSRRKMLCRYSTSGTPCVLGSAWVSPHEKSQITFLGKHVKETPGRGTGNDTFQRYSHQILPVVAFSNSGLTLHAKLLQSRLPLCDPMECNPPGSSVHGIFQARILEWVAMPASRGSLHGSNQRLSWLLLWQASSLPVAPPGQPSNKLLCPWDSPGKDTGVGSHPVLQGSSWSTDQTLISCIEGRLSSELPGKPRLTLG